MQAAIRKSRRGSGTVTVYRSRMAIAFSLVITGAPVRVSVKSKWKRNGTQTSPRYGMSVQIRRRIAMKALRSCPTASIPGA